MSERVRRPNGKTTFSGKSDGISAKIRNEVFQLNGIIGRLCSELDKDVRSMMLDAAALAAKTAAMHTPPDIGKRNPRKLLRKIRTLNKEWSESKNKYVKIPKKRWRYQVSIEKNGKASGENSEKNKKYFDNKQAADKWRRIPGRGSARAGWWGGAQKIIDKAGGAKITTNLNNIKVDSRLVARAARELSKSDVSDQGYTVEMSNRYPNISDFAGVSAFMGYKSVVNRWKHWIPKEKKKLEAMNG
jgi:hypothetical protein